MIRPLQVLLARAVGCVLVLALLALAHTAAAQKSYAVPESPAFTFLNVTPAEISRPGSVRAFGAAVLDGISASGEIKQGLALDFAPWTYLPGVSITLRDYQTNPVLYALANTQTSLATARAAGDSADTDLAFGIRVTLFDRTDPMADTAYTNELRRRIAAKCEIIIFDEDEDLATRRTCLSTVTREWQNTWRDERSRWNGSSLAVAFAGGGQLNESLIGQAHWGGASAWVTGSVGVGTSGLVVGQLRYQAGEDEAPAGFSYGARGFVGTRVANAFLEIVRDDRVENSAGLNWTGGLEFRAADRLWLSTGLGSRASDTDDERRTVLIADMRWNIADAPRLAPGR